MERYFNTAGPIIPSLHYYIPPLARLDFEELLMLIRQMKYFVMHAPRQTGKTSAILALRDRLNADGEFCCVYAIGPMTPCGCSRLGPSRPETLLIHDRTPS